MTGKDFTELRAANDRMTPGEKYERLRNALGQLTPEERAAMAYGMDHPEEWGIDQICIGGFYGETDTGGVQACPETLMMLKMGTGTLTPVFFSQAFDDEKGEQCKTYDSLWKAIDHLLPVGVEHEEEAMRTKETVFEVRRLLSELEGTNG